MKTLKNVGTMYRDFEEGSIIVLDKDVSISSLKSLIADLARDLSATLKSKTGGMSDEALDWGETDDEAAAAWDAANPKSDDKAEKSISSDAASGILETVFAIKSILKAMGQDVEVEADKQDELKDIQTEENKKNPPKGEAKSGDTPF